MRILKITGVIVGVLVLLLVGAAIALPLIVDPNDFKPRIQAAVEEATGRQLEIPGDIKLSLFPWLGAELGAVRFGNATGFGAEPFAAIEGVQVRVKLLPLLAREVEVGKVVIEQPVIRLERNADGVTNWEDLAGETRAEEAPAQEEDVAPTDLSVDGIEIRNARILYADSVANVRAELSEFHLEAGRVALPADFPLSMRGVVKVSEPALTGSFQFQGRLVADPEGQQYAVADGTLTFDAEGDGLPVSPLQARVAWARLAADLAAQTAAVETLTLEALGLRADIAADASRLDSGPAAEGEIVLRASDLAETATQLRTLLPEGVQLSGQADGKLAFRYDGQTGSAEVPSFAFRALGMDIAGKVTASNLAEAPAFQGSLRVAEFSPGQLLVKLGQELPATRDGSVLDSATLALSFDVAPNRARLGDLHATLDQTTLKGRIEIADIERQALRFDLAVDQIDVDRYLPAGTAKEEQAASETPLDQTEIPAELVRGLNINGALRIGKLKAFDFNSTDVSIGVTAQNNALRVHPAEAKFYEGGYRGDIRLDASKDVPVVSVNERVDRVQLAPMVKDVLDVENISGTAEMHVQARATGSTVGALRKTLDGTFAVDVRDGAIEGFNLWESIREAYATFKGRSHDASKAPDRTEFAELSASGVIRKGVLNNDDLLAKLPFLRVNGSGAIDIAKATMDYTVEATVLKSPELGGEIQELANVAIPVRLTGALTDPRVRPDVKGVLEAKAKEALKRKEQEVRDEAKRKAEEEKKRLEEKLKDKLKGLRG